MTILGGLAFVVPLLSGALLVHLIWPERGLAFLPMKLALAVGVGLGLRSLLYFVYLLLFAGQNWFIGVEVGSQINRFQFFTGFHRLQFSRR